MTRSFSRPALSREVQGFPEEVWDAIADPASRGQVVAISNLIELPDEQVRLTVGNATHQSASEFRENRWTLWHTGVVAAVLAIGGVLLAVVYLVMQLVAWISAHTVQFAGFVVIGAIAVFITFAIIKRN